MPRILNRLKRPSSTDPPSAQPSSSLHERMALLRHLLHHPPSPDRWQRLCELFTHWPTAERDALHIATDYARQHLAQHAWPDALRTAPITWWSDVRRGLTPPYWSLARLLDLSACLGFGADAVRELAAAPPIASLTQLSLNHRVIHAIGARALANSPHLSQLTHLMLHQCHIGPNGARALADSPHLTRLTHLNLSHNHIGPSGVQALARSPLMAQLTTLSLAELPASFSPSPMGPEGLQALIGAVHRQLTHLNIAHNGLGGEDIAHLAASPIDSLIHLDLHGNPMGLAGARALADSPHLSRLTHLNLGQTDLNSGGLAALAGSPNLSQLTHLVLRHNPLRLAAIRALADSPHLSRLTHLDLSQIPLPPEAVQALANSPYLSRLTHLDLSGSLVGPRGCAALSQLNAPLQTLHLDRTMPGQTGLHQLARKAPWLNTVRTLSL
ncbi:MAG: hypothetical protein AAFS10_15220, partial [Myxococcota bacterium]